MAESQRKVTLFVFDASDRPIELRYDNDNFNAVAIRRVLDAFLMPVASFILEMSVLKTGNTIIITSSTDAGKKTINIPFTEVLKEFIQEVERIKNMYESREE